MIRGLTDWAHNAFFPPRQRRTVRRPVNSAVVSALVSTVAAERLEPRDLLTLNFGSLLVNNIPAGKDGLIALPIVNSTTNPVTYTVQSNNANVTGTIVSDTLSLQLLVTGKDGSGNTFTGDLTFRLFPSLAPTTVSQIEDLANTNFYDGLSFHRVIQDFVAQGGDPLGNGSGGSGTKIPDEYRTNMTFTSQGLLAMANSGDDTGDSQFFITDIDETLANLPQHLNFNHTIFGILTGGFDTFRQVMSTPVDVNDKPTTKLEIVNATIFNETQSGVLRVTPTAGFTGTARLTVTANDGAGATAQREIDVTVVADTQNDRPFLGAVSNKTAIQGQPVEFTVQGFDLENDTLNFVVKDAASFTGTNVGNAPANVSVQITNTPAANGNPASALIRLTPSVTFAGTVNLTVGVRDQTLRDGTTNLDSRSNFDGQNITLTVTAVNHAPNAPGGTISTPSQTAVAIQLPGDDGDPDKTQTLTYEIVSQPASGTISGFNALTGGLTFTPAAQSAGPVTFTYRIKDNGGTDNGGADTSSTAVFTVQVGAVAPTNLALTAASDTGVSNSDRVTSDDTPTFTMSAQTGSTVLVTLNGSTVVPTTETSPGVYSATLTPAFIKVGTNSLTAAAITNGQNSAATEPLSFIFAPDYRQIYTVPGTPGQAQQVSFQVTAKNSAYKSEFGYYIVDSAGVINNVAPTASGYTQAVLSSNTRVTVFAPGVAAGTVNTVNLTAGQKLAFYLVADSTAATALKNNPRNGVGGPSTYFSVDTANPDSVDHLNVQADNHTGRAVLSWEDLRGGGDRDYNDLVIGITPAATASVSAGDPLRLPSGNNQNVSVRFDLLQGQKPAAMNPPAPKTTADGELGIYFVTDSNGTVNGLAPGAAGYLQAVLNSNTRQALFTQGDTVGTQRTVSLGGGNLIGWYYIPQGTAAQALANNPTNNAAQQPVVFLSFDAANPDQKNHFRWYGPERNGATRQANDASAPLRMHVSGTLNPTEANFDDYQINITLPE